MEPKIERQEVSATNPLQYKFTSYKAVKDINGTEFFVEDKVEIKNTLELDVEIEQILKQILELEKRIEEINAKKTQIGEVKPDLIIKEN